MQEQVRLATPDDEQECTKLLTMLHAEGGLMPLNMPMAQQMFGRAFHRNGAILGVIGEPGDIKAMIFLLISRFWYTEHFHLEELFNFIRPDARKSDYASRMIDFAKKCADETKLPLVIGVLTNSRMEGKVRLYRRKLGYPAGAFFVHNAQWRTAEDYNEDFWKGPFPSRVKPNGNGKVTDHVR